MVYTMNEFLELLPFIILFSIPVCAYKMLSNKRRVCVHSQATLLEISNTLKEIEKKLDETNR